MARNTKFSGWQTDKEWLAFEEEMRRADRATQRQAVLERLKQGPATMWDLTVGLRILRPGARIFELRKQGYEITSSEQRLSGKRIVTYTLQGHAVQLPAMPPSVPYVSLQRKGMRKCLNPPCTVVFKPKTKRQFYHSDRCRFQDWERRNPRLNFSTDSRSCRLWGARDSEEP